MRILWIPHCSWEKARSRDQYFIEELKERHEFHVVSWTQPSDTRIRGMLDPGMNFAGLQEWRVESDGITIHHMRRFQTTRFTKPFLKVNEKHFREMINRVVREERIDVAIFACSHYLNGFPPFDIGIPVVFDYVDYIYDADVRNEFLKNSDCVLCVSHELQKQALDVNDNCQYLPNGVNISAIRSGIGSKVRDRFGIGDSPLISLIGITYGKNAYFLDAFDQARKTLRGAKLVVVGESPNMASLRKKAMPLGKDVIFTGWVSPREVSDYFMATDIGLNPVAIDPYFDAACSIKVIEFAAANKPVVSARVKDLENLRLSNVLLTNDEPIDFCRGILESMNRTFPPPDLEPFDIEKLALSLERILKAL